MRIVEPLKEREPFFEGWQTDEGSFTYPCPGCALDQTIGFTEILKAAWGWRERTGEPLRSELAKQFRINLSDRSIGNGMDAVVDRACPQCAANVFVCFSFLETSNSVYRISLSAIAENEAPNKSVDTNT